MKDRSLKITEGGYNAPILTILQIRPEAGFAASDYTNTEEMPDDDLVDPWSV